MEQDLKWTCGKDPSLECQGCIGEGGCGTIYKMIRKDRKPIFGSWGKTSNDGKVFARKLTRVRLSVKQEDVEHEIKALESLYRTGGHPNIIEVLEHGWLETTGRVYYLDMELADLSLAEYIATIFHNRPLPCYVNYFAEFDAGVEIQPVVVEQVDGVTSEAFTLLSKGVDPLFPSKPRTQLERLDAMLTIGSQIAKGLEFIHQSGFVHRDLKPGNVLYCRQWKLWKLIDFGFTSAGMSTAKTTRYSRGTEGHRAPELLNDDHPRYSNRSDIWALGGILHELATGSRIFASDHATAKHYDKDPLPELPMHISYDTKFRQSQISYCLSCFLAKEFDRRPSASLASRHLSAYRALLDLPGMKLLTNVSPPPVYLEWENVMKPGLSIVESLVELGKWCLKNGHDEVGRLVMNDIIPILKQSMSDHHLNSKSMSQSETKPDDGRSFSAPVMSLTRDRSSSTSMINVQPTSSQEKPRIRQKSLTCLEASEAAKDEVNLLFNQGQDFKKQDSDWVKRLHDAVVSGHEEVVATLLQQNPEVDVQDDDGNTALHWAAFQGQEKVFEKLLQHKADADKQNTSGHSTLLWARCYSHEKFVRFRLLQNANVDMQTLFSWTPLFWAAINGREKMVKALLLHNADVNKRLSFGRTSLFWAVFSGQAKVVQVLLQHDADADKQDEKGNTALHLAAATGQEKIVQVLLQHNAVVGTQDCDGRTGLHYATFYGYEKVVQVLLQYNVDVDRQDRYGRTAFDVGRAC